MVFDETWLHWFSNGDENARVFYKYASRDPPIRTNTSGPGLYLQCPCPDKFLICRGTTIEHE